MSSSAKNIIIAVLIVALGAVGYFAFTKNTSTPQQNQPANTSSNNDPRGATINLSGQNLTTLDKSLLDNSSVTTLDVSNNRLTGALPAEIRKLSNLETLNASHNNLTGIPAEIGQLHKLKTIDFSYNDISGMPMELGELRQLEILDLRGNKKLSPQDLGQIRNKLPRARILTD